MCIRDRQILAEAPTPDPSDPDQMCHAGPFATTDLGESGVAKLGLVEKVR